MTKLKRKPRERVPFIEDACGADETLLLTAHLHWIFLLKGATALLVFMWIGRVFDTYSEKFIPNLVNYNLDTSAFMLYKLGDYVEKGCFVIGAVICLMYIVAFLTTTIGLTTKRLMLRTGLIFVKLTNVDLEEFKGEYVDHGFLGRFLNYGEIHMDARFVSNFYVPTIADPYRLIRAINEARASVGDSVVAGEVPLQEVPLQPVRTGIPAASHAYVPMQEQVVIAPAVAHQTTIAAPVVTMRAGDLPPDMPVAVTEVKATRRLAAPVVKDIDVDPAADDDVLHSAFAGSAKT